MTVTEVKQKVRCRAPMCSSDAAYSFGRENAMAVNRIYLCKSCAEELFTCLKSALKVPKKDAEKRGETVGE
ncbi:MAG: hypothetical protein LBT20_02105 [Clostridiales bacterium]|nr:hypothetical protein [Clostridiales bacterium]